MTERGPGARGNECDGDWAARESTTASINTPFILLHSLYREMIIRPHVWCARSELFTSLCLFFVFFVSLAGVLYHHDDLMKDDLTIRFDLMRRDVCMYVSSAWNPANSVR